MKYAYIDGDDIGLRIEKSFMTNNEHTLLEINNEVSESVTKISQWLEKHKYKIIFSGADGIICKKENINVDELHVFIKNQKISITFSIGIGNSLRDAFLALRYAKSNGKNGVAILEEDFQWIKNLRPRNNMINRSTKPASTRVFSNLSQQCATQKVGC